MARVLVLFAHPALEKSRVHRRLVARVPARPELTFHDLYEAYPAFDVDVAREQALLAGHDVVVLQFPFYWYSTPALLKQWEDLVLTHGWAYGAAGRALEGKRLLCAVSTGGRAGAYEREGYNGFSVREFLLPIEATARLCRMRYLAPWVVNGTHRLDAPEIEEHARRYGALLDALCEERWDDDAGAPSSDAQAAGTTGRAGA
jgi:glutathione-regulated potassium-efflux system ancillary protein KefG